MNLPDTFACGLDSRLGSSRSSCVIMDIKNGFIGGVSESLGCIKISGVEIITFSLPGIMFLSLRPARQGDSLLFDVL